jgi:hypothetical protein
LRQSSKFSRYARAQPLSVFLVRNFETLAFCSGTGCTCVSHVHLGLGPGSLSLSEREIVLKSKSNFLFPNDKLQRLDIGMVLFDLELRGVPENLRNLSKVYKFTP